MQVDIQLSTVSSASVPGQWRLCINHTRSGSSKAAKVPSGERGVRFKKKILLCALDRVAASAPTPGIVVGDLNLTRQQVQEVSELAGPRAHSVRFIGGQGQTACYLPCCVLACHASCHASLVLAMRLAMPACSCHASRLPCQLLSCHAYCHASCHASDPSCHGSCHASFHASCVLPCVLPCQLLSCHASCHASVCLAMP